MIGDRTDDEEDDDSEVHEIPISVPGEEPTENSEERAQSQTSSDQASDEGGSPRTRWRKQLYERREELSQTDDPDERSELIRKIQDLEDRMVKEGYLDENERGDYERVRLGQNETTDAKRGEAPTDTESDAESSGASDRKSEDNEVTESTGTDETRNSASEGTDEEEEGHGITVGTISVEEPEDESETGGTSSDRERDARNDAGSEEAGGSGKAETDEPESSRKNVETGGADEESTTVSSAETEEAKVQEEEQPSADSEGEFDESEADSSTSETTSGKQGSDPAVDREEFARLRSRVEAVEDDVGELDQFVSELKRKNNREHEELQKYSIEQFASNMLRVRDTMERALEIGSWDDSEKPQLEAVVQQFDQQFTSGNIDTIEPDTGTEFDPRRHSMTAKESTNEVDGNEVVRVERVGFILFDRIIRPAEVVVARGN